MEAREYKMDEETAENEFMRWGEAMDLDLEKSHMDEEDLASFEDAKRRFVEGLRRGCLILNDNVEPVFTTKKGLVLTFHEPGGDAFLATDSRKKGHDIGKTHAAAAAITEQPMSIFAGIKGWDLKLVYAIVGLLVGG